ncbi:MAG: hypothetical protein ABGZ23_16040, partial [Fuerstiella sp.]
MTIRACKTVFTQRLKQSGMRWSHEGARQILVLRTILSPIRTYTSKGVIGDPQLIFSGVEENGV